MSPVEGRADHHAKEVRQAAGGRRAEIGLLGVGLKPGGVILEGFDRAVGRYGQGKREITNLAHGREVGLGVVAELVEHHGRQHRHNDGRDHDGVAIGGSSFQELGRQTTAGTRTVVDDHRALEFVFHLFGQDSGDDINGYAGRETDHNPQGFIRLSRS